MALKYGCPSQTTWLLATDSLFTFLTVVQPVARKHGQFVRSCLDKADWFRKDYYTFKSYYFITEKKFERMWIELGDALEDFFFSKQLVT